MEWSEDHFMIPSWRRMNAILPSHRVGEINAENTEGTVRLVLNTGRFPFRCLGYLLRNTILTELVMIVSVLPTASHP